MRRKYARPTNQKPKGKIKPTKIKKSKLARHILQDRGEKERRAAESQEERERVRTQRETGHTNEGHLQNTLHVHMQPTHAHAHAHLQDKQGVLPTILSHVELRAFEKRERRSQIREAIV
jgi:hypothetical protein